MKYVRNERGNAVFFMVWLLGVVAIIFLIVLNLAKVFIVKEHANLSVEQAALAGTAAIIERTKEAVSQFDSGPESVAQRVLDGGKSIGEMIEEKEADYIASGASKSDAYIKAANEILPPRLQIHPLLKISFRNRLGNDSSDLYGIASAAIQEIIAANEANIEDTEILVDEDDWRLEVKSTATFQSISDNKYIQNILADIPQRGYGPSLAYLESVYSGGHPIFP
ncbi:hypothetical protein G3A_01715 [Bacillus sp. 17376]|uniref:Uncharacterized protein n=1 Tax=Mesobacillus boroniphilus JCM 21738 TaxID=1294265 RepID=W4RSN2_9BACI|nr:hypothetical protein [Mesobacillus boroniphilus]ESU34318.1 hypothetical protein G3A_01715 [Bacillus sp. 17376]GAE46664.1 hypothetical protein JCM21738_3582 [Mesobacillus boroniphilus JCM 21738]